MADRTVMILFDLDGTLIDSNAALLAPFAALGVPADRLAPLGLPLGAACERAGVTVTQYLAHYDIDATLPFPGVADMLASVGPWAICSNKDRWSGEQELRRLGWIPVHTLFSDDFGGMPKALGPMLSALNIEPAHAVFIGDTEHDRAWAALAGVPFALAGWNPRVIAVPGDVVLGAPSDVLRLLT